MNSLATDAEAQIFPLARLPVPSQPCKNLVSSYESPLLRRLPIRLNRVPITSPLIHSLRRNHVHSRRFLLVGNMFPATRRLWILNIFRRRELSNTVSSSIFIKK
jgi:hypothetical protein